MQAKREARNNRGHQPIPCRLLVGAVLALLSAVALTACGGGGGGGGPDSCSDTPRINSTPFTTATAGQQYSYVVSWDRCLLCTSLLPVRLPPGAGVFGSGIYWTPSANDINRNVPFEISTPANFCGDSAKQSWSVTVFAPPAILSFTTASGSIKRGERAILMAVFQGRGRIDGLGTITSGVPITTSPLNVSSTFTLYVSNDIGFELHQSVSVQVPSPPAIQSLTALPTRIVAGAISTLSWATGGDFTVAHLDPVGIDVRGVTSIAVTPSATTTYTLVLSDDVGATANASVQVEVVQMPAIESFVATPASSVLGGTVSLTARFQGTARIDPLSDGPANSTLGAVNSGVPIASPPLRRSSGFRLVVEDILGRQVSQDLFVEITGPGTFRPTSGSPIVARRRHSATRLADGRVFIAGGLFTDSTEIYDPVTDTFTAGPPLLEPRQLHSAVLLRDGRVLLSGGFSVEGGSFSHDQIYDPSSGFMTATSWTPVWAPALRLLDDRVFIGGGGGAYIVNASGTTRGPFILSGETFTGCRGSSVVRLSDGRILDVFGYPAPSPIFSPVTDSFTLTGAVARDRGCGYLATLTGDGRVLVTGGSLTAEIYDPTTGLFSDVGSQQTFASFGTGTSLSNGKALLIGGGLSPWAEIFDPETRTFTETGGMRVGRGEYTATVLLDGRVLVVGGCEGLPCKAEVYTPP